MLILSPLFTIVFCFVSNYDGPRAKELAIYNNMFNETGVEKKKARSTYQRAREMTMETLARGQPKREEPWEGRSRQPYSRIPQIYIY